jgi:hypothetical protein
MSRRDRVRVHYFLLVSALIVACGGDRFEKIRNIGSSGDHLFRG